MAATHNLETPLAQNSYPSLASSIIRCFIDPSTITLLIIRPTPTLITPFTRAGLEGLLQLRIQSAAYKLRAIELETICVRQRSVTMLNLLHLLTGTTCRIWMGQTRVWRRVGTGELLRVDSIISGGTLTIITWVSHGFGLRQHHQVTVLCQIVTLSMEIERKSLIAFNFYSHFNKETNKSGFLSLDIIKDQLNLIKFIIFCI